MSKIKKEDCRYYKIVCPCGISYLVEWSKVSDKFTIYEHNIEEDEDKRRRGRPKKQEEDEEDEDDDDVPEESSEDEEAPEEENDNTLSRLEFQAIKDAQKDGRSSKEVAEEYEFLIGQVNLAYNSSTYGMYIINRKKDRV